MIIYTVGICNGLCRKTNLTDRRWSVWQHTKLSRNLIVAFPSNHGLCHFCHVFVTMVWHVVSSILIGVQEQSIIRTVFIIVRVCNVLKGKQLLRHKCFVINKATNKMSNFSKIKWRRDNHYTSNALGRKCEAWQTHCYCGGWYNRIGSSSEIK